MCLHYPQVEGVYLLTQGESSLRACVQLMEKVGKISAFLDPAPHPLSSPSSSPGQRVPHSSACGGV